MKKLLFIISILAFLGANSQGVKDLSNPAYWVNINISGTLTGNIANFNTINVADSLGIGGEYISEFTYTDSITTNIGNSTTGVPNIFVDTLHQNGVATVKIAVSLTDDETYNLPSAKNVFGKVLTGANYVDFIIQTQWNNNLRRKAERLLLSLRRTPV